MQWMKRNIVFAVLVFTPYGVLLAQATQTNPATTAEDSLTLESFREQFGKVPETATITIRDILISGNKKTNEKIILREIPFKEGEQYELKDLVKKIEDAKRQLKNTVLFHEVEVEIKKFEDNHADILIAVKERWYLFPIPYFKYIDRNLNEWLFQNNASFKRVNYGLKVLYNNVTGYNDKLNLWLINGYTKQVSINYDRLYIDKKLKWGLNTAIALGKNREVNYSTVNNKQLFFKDTSNFVRSYFKTNAEITYRRAIRTRHRIGVAYTDERVSDTIVALNPSYFKDGRNRIRFPEIYYSMSYFDVDYIPYPLQGYQAEGSFVKRGFNNIINLWQLTAKGGGSWKIAKNTYFGTRISGTVKFPFNQPYIHQRLFGYSDFFMQGYEYYVIDGVAGGYIKTIVTRELFNFFIRYRKAKIGSVDRIPMRIFAKAYTNAGYIHHPNPGENGLSNRMLYSGGVGLDLLTFYDFTFRLEWSFNQLGQNGLYLHRKSNF